MYSIADAFGGGEKFKVVEIGNWNKDCAWAVTKKVFTRCGYDAVETNCCKSCEVALESANVS